ncbi:AAA family ATPase [Ruania halotolerans]|uniref:AAA family ATPase n=1 Tax=Ruania halotolerans TaxID=2897773 RepID=UPI002096A18F|nr:MoxR family ATPase [Ruania halotolerans]
MSTTPPESGHQPDHSTQPNHSPLPDHQGPQDPYPYGGQNTNQQGAAQGPEGASGQYQPSAPPPAEPPPSGAAPSAPAPAESGGAGPNGPAYPTSAPTQPQPAPPEETTTQQEIRASLARVRTEVAKAVVGQDAAVTGLVIALLCRGHVLLEGVPGVAKTLLTRTLGASLDLEMKRVQFTPDLMPGDVTGSLVYDARTAEFSFREGPVFTNLMLADEINRTPPKTQASLLEAMEERQVSVDGEPRMLPEPFVVIATQNPVEYEGTYPLPEAQLDRFLIKLILPIPERAAEIEVLNRHAHAFDPRNLEAAGVRRVAGPDDLAAARADVAAVEVGPEVLAYIVDICRATRTSPSLSLGVSPRGATALLATSRAWAWLSGRRYVTPDDVKALAHPTLRHRVQLRAEAELEGISAESVLDGILGSVPVPR